MIHISLDLETWGTRPGFDLRSIGVCVFAPHTRHGGSLVHDGSLGTIKPFYLATANPCVPDDKSGCWRKYPLKRDPETVQWWTEQTDEAQAAFADPVDLREALTRFAAWLDMITADVRPIDNPSAIPGLINPDGSADMIDVRAYGVTHDQPRPLHKCDVIRLWSHGAAFDPGILAEAYHAVGLPVPWHYRAPRDTRTAFDMAGIEDHSAWLAQHPGPLGITHHALDDAICQARAVCAAMARLRVPDDVKTHRDAWRLAIGVARDLSMGDSESDDTDYYNHEIAVFDRTFDKLADYPHLVDNP